MTVPLRCRVDNRTVADDACDLFVENAGGDQVEHVFLVADAHGVASVGPPLIARNDVCMLGEHVDNFPFSFVAPLGADNNLDRHWWSRSFVVVCIVRCQVGKKNLRRFT
ncbi:MAG: hypothetical protein HW412_1656 [Bacteroidetes bacterium]|nr:hypothetical protein [Bacteroidota bacterium]